jgi:hypothetical protein
VKKSGLFKELIASAEWYRHLAQLCGDSFTA